MGYVFFYAFGNTGGSVYLGTVYSPPYQVSWVPSVADRYQVYAYAYNAQGTYTLSAPVGITVNTPPPVVGNQAR